MPSFDAVSKVDTHELSNAVDQANRELSTRFDFKGVEASFELKDNLITLLAPSDFQVQQMQDILTNKLVKRGIEGGAISFNDMETNLAQAKLTAEVKQGLSTEVAKKITKLIKNEKFKVQASIQGEQVRVTGKKRDDLQEVIAFLKEAKVEQPLQFENFRD